MKEEKTLDERLTAIIEKSNKKDQQYKELRENVRDSIVTHELFPDQKYSRLRLEDWHRSSIISSDLTTKTIYCQINFQEVEELYHRYVAFKSDQLLDILSLKLKYTMDYSKVIWEEFLVNTVDMGTRKIKSRLRRRTLPAETIKQIMYAIESETTWIED